MKKKTSSEILDILDKDEKRREDLKKIREERKELEKEMDVSSKPQKRKVEIIEYEDGTFSLEGYAYALPLQRDEVEYAFISWLDNSLENGSLFEKWKRNQNKGK